MYHYISRVLHFSLFNFGQRKNIRQKIEKSSRRTYNRIRGRRMYKKKSLGDTIFVAILFVVL